MGSDQLWRPNYVENWYYVEESEMASSGGAEGSKGASSSELAS